MAALVVIAIVCAFLGVVEQAGATDNPLLTELVEQGVDIGAGAKYRLPAPTMADGLDAQGQRAALESIADPLRTVERLVRQSVVAPQVLNIETVKEDGLALRTRSVDVWFVAYGELDALVNEEFLTSLGRLAQESQSSDLPTDFKVLDEADLAERQLTVGERENFKEFYYHTTFPLLERVLLRLTRHAIGTRSDDSILLASKLDPQFVDDTEFPNQWAPITRDSVGRPVIGEGHPYADAAFYIKATKLIEPAGAVFIEYHLVYEEPYGWFDGANLLRSKIPLIVQDVVRDFRREFEKSKPEGK